MTGIMAGKDGQSSTCYEECGVATGASVTLPVWLCSDPDDDCWVFVAAPDRMAARRDVWWAFDLDRLVDVRCRKVLANGTIGGRGEQATVDADAARELTTAECVALGWRTCGDCGRWTQEPTGYMCQDCAEWADDGVRP